VVVVLTGHNLHMSNNKPISVKVKTDKLLTALKESLASRKEEMKAQDKADADFTKAIKEWETKVVDYIKSGKGKVTEVSQTHDWRKDTDNARVTITLPANLSYPTKDNALRATWEIKGEVEELENAIAILNMSDEEFVSTSTYKGVARLIK